MIKIIYSKLFNKKIKIIKDKNNIINNKVIIKKLIINKN